MFLWVAQVLPAEAVLRRPAIRQRDQESRFRRAISPAPFPPLPEVRLLRAPLRRRAEGVLDGPQLERQALRAHDRLVHLCVGVSFVQRIRVRHARQSAWVPRSRCARRRPSPRRTAPIIHRHRVIGPAGGAPCSAPSRGRYTPRRRPSQRGPAGVMRARRSLSVRERGKIHC